MNKSKLFAEAILKDYSNPLFRKRIEDSKTDAWRDPLSFWKKILTNQMHMGSSSRVLLKRIETEGFRLASNYNHFSELNAMEKKQILDSFVPGSPFASKENKVTTLLSAFDFISKKGITATFSPELKKVELLKNLRNIPGIGSKQSRNIAMDLYHPSFRNFTIPIDNNWKKISKFLEYKWSDSDKHENEIIEWRNTYICRDTISEDWEFDRLIYIALNDSTSEVYSIVNIQ